MIHCLSSRYGMHLDALSNFPSFSFHSCSTIAKVHMTCLLNQVHNTHSTTFRMPRSLSGGKRPSKFWERKPTKCETAQIMSPHIHNDCRVLKIYRYTNGKAQFHRLEMICAKCWSRIKKGPTEIIRDFMTEKRSQASLNLERCAKNAIALVHCLTAWNSWRDTTSAQPHPTKNLTLVVIQPGDVASQKEAVMLPPSWEKWAAGSCM